MAGFLKKIWKPRIVEYPGRRRLDDTSQPEVYDVSRAEGNIIQQGDGFTADNMNNLEERIFSGFDNAEKVISDEFSTEKTYSSGEYAIYNNTLYRFTAAKPAGAWDASKVQAMTVAGALRELNANIGKKQDASTAITTGNIGQQSVKHATTAGSASAVAWGNVSGKPGTYPPSGHNHDDRYYTETEINNVLAGKARIVRQGWGKTLSIPGLPHGLIFVNAYNLYLILAAGVQGSYEINKTLLLGNDNLNISINANNGTVTASFKDVNLIGAITYIGS